MLETLARRLWESYEPVHDVVYFTPECASAAEQLGLRGFWMGYFAFRAAPMGPVGPAPVAASFYGFHPERVARALPDAWSYASPKQALEARKHGAAASLRRLWGEQTARSPQVTEAAELAWQAAQAVEMAGRVLGAANQALERPDDPVEALWQATTTLREHRGDGHVAVLVNRDVPPVQAHLLKTASGESEPEMLRKARKWSTDSWERAGDELHGRGWLDTDGCLSASGDAERAEIELHTDRLAQAPWAALGEQNTQRLAALLEPLAEAIVQSGALPPRNPVGLTRAHRLPDDALPSAGRAAAAHAVHKDRGPRH